MKDPDPKGMKFYASVGQCITSWSMLEDVLFEICHSVLKTEKKISAIVFYYRTPTFSARLSLANELVRSTVPPLKSGDHNHPLIAKWGDLEKETRALMEIRNAIAHKPVSRIYKVSGSPDPAKQFVEEPYFTISPSENERLGRTPTKPEKVLLASDLPEHAAKVSALRKRLREFQKELESHLAQI